jgi:hypothetical protein
MRRALGVLWLDVRPGSLIARCWRYSTTLGHVVLLQPGLAGSPVEAHELVHVRQFEGAVCSVWLVALSCGLAHAAAGWAAGAALALLGGPWWSYAGASLSAALRGERPYLDNHFERHARAEVEVRSRAALPQRGGPAGTPPADRA